MATWKVVSTRPVWCFDVEARPGPWLAADITAKHMLSLAGCYAGKPKTMAYLAPGFDADDLEEFVTPIREGALVVTHNGFRYDLPFLNGTLIRLGLRPLGSVLVHDTYHHLPKRGRAFSGSLGNMARRFDVGVSKGSMSEYDWDLAYQGDPTALEKLRVYNVGDVKTTLALRKKLMELNLLRPPSRWNP